MSRNSRFYVEYDESFKDYVVIDSDSGMAVSSWDYPEDAVHDANEREKTVAKH